MQATDIFFKLTSYELPIARFWSEICHLMFVQNIHMHAYLVQFIFSDTILSRFFQIFSIFVKKYRIVSETAYVQTYI